MGRMHILRIMLDSHYHGSSDVPRPWVARLSGPCPTYGARRQFLDQLNDWSEAKRTISGRRSGVVACFALRGGHLYEVSRLRGKSSKRHVAREFARVDEDGAWHDLELDEALLALDPCDGGIPIWVPEGTRVSLIERLGTPTALGFLTRDDQRRYQLRHEALHEALAQDGAYRLILVRGGEIEDISSEEALQWLASR